MRRRWQRLSLLARLLLIGVLGVATALGIGSVALYGVLTLASYRTLDASGRATAADVAGLVTQGRLPDPIPVTGSQIVQVVDGRDRVVSASVNADRLTALLLPAERAEAVAGSPVTVPGSRVGLASPLRVVAVLATSPGGARTVVVAQGTADIEHSQHILRTTLLATYPLLLAVLALIAWRVVGAALAPVELLRATAERISGTDEQARLPVPPSGDEVHALAVTLNSMLDRLSASRARQRSFVADAAHELRSPLASMRTQLDVARHLGEAPEVTEGLLEEVVRMTGLVDDLLLLARLDAEEPVRAEIHPVDVRPLVEEVVGRYRHARVPVTVAVAGDGAEEMAVRAREDAVRRAVRNLVDNAVRHAASRVQVSVRRDGDGGDAGNMVLVEVCDDGSGIAAEDRDRVFERFTRLDDARSRDAGGSGLGLPIVAELVARAGGSVQLGDSPGGGLSARLRFPRD
jgi:signal transduction histidine kinase